MSAYNKKIQFISLPEVTDRISITKEIKYSLNKVVTTIKSNLVPYVIEVDDGNNVIIISNPYISEYKLVFMRSHIRMNDTICLWMGSNTFYIYSTSIYDFISEQISLDNYTLFIPELV